MFTGIVEEQGQVIANLRVDVANRLIIKSTFSQLVIGESIAVNGVCLTLVPNEDGNLAFDVSPETLSLTNLGALKAGDRVNLERAMSVTARFGGHYVSGHVDTTARLIEKTKAAEYVEIVVGDFQAPAGLYLLPKGSITLDGISLTINEVLNERIKLMLVPHTLAKTTFGQLNPGQRINVEFDYLTRIVAHQLKMTGQLKNEVEA
ncbi:riboflavin synthase [Legionella jordanis]|uniref:Riboflavin synthase n=1 Tax=Legionella jordanis TaxID=456 RepID=A0A0W0VA06_9GAMM|nr:riboflavin synthase [Legionella jordanis]KTD16956.1 riboflavin synthase alpha chain [Legionella jordanis]RMX03099.1 riboflavin synthase [Legionella jordanis]RMX18762.1 riboflavin synthase [Legionella jordanis]VEH12850.1 riboflavin synthase alpha chain [Legionella jordanis]HAT8713007.1 riboflavin synthase [Legionella jordanis]